MSLGQREKGLFLLCRVIVVETTGMTEGRGHARGDCPKRRDDLEGFLPGGWSVFVSAQELCEKPLYENDIYIRSCT